MERYLLNFGVTSFTIQLANAASARQYLSRTVYDHDGAIVENSAHSVVDRMYMYVK